MSETEEPTGSDFTLANAGLTRAPTEPVAAEPATYGPGINGAMDAANDLTRERGSSETEPVERHLEWKTGEKRGQRVDLKKERMSLSVDQAAKTLSEVHRTEDAIEANENLRNLANEVDYARLVTAGVSPSDAQQQTEQAETPQAQPDAPQPESIEQPSGLDPEVSAALQNPKVRAVLEPALQQSEAARQAYTGMAQQAADVALSSLLVNFPELSGYNGQQLGVVISHIERENPERANLIRDQISKVSGLATAAQQAKQQQAQMEQAQFQQWAAQEDTAFDNANRGEF